MKELSNLIKEVHADSSRPDTQFAFRLLYPHPKHGRMTSRELGVVHNGRQGRDDGLGLGQAGFVQGDCVDVAIFVGVPVGGGMVADEVGLGGIARFGRRV